MYIFQVAVLGMGLLLKLTLIALLPGDVISEAAPTVTIRQGILMGKYQQSTNGRRFSWFSGIPYAKPPVGNLRFKVPVPAEPWGGVFNATQLHSICPQMFAVVGDYVVKGDEDCLYLNVYTPEVSGIKMPVMCFIHGGGWMWGSANSDLYGPEHLMTKDIVLVTVNYRLGALGFLSSGDDVVPGNNGLKDQSLALRWIYDNIDKFGGDPNQITVFGQSAGASSAHYHTLSPLSRDIIKRAILNSGTAFSPWALSTNLENQRNSRKLAQYFDCPLYPSTKMVQCLQQVKAEYIVANEKTLYVWSFFPIIPFKPVIESNIEGAFITEDPAKIIESGKAANVSYIIGITRNEGVFVTAAFRENVVTEDFYNRYEQLLPMLSYSDGTYDSASKIKQFYFENALPNTSQLSMIITDTWFGVPLNEAIGMHMQYNNAPVFQYLFQYRGTRSFTELFGTSNDYEVSHCDDLLYLFTTQMLGNYQPSQNDMGMIELMVNLWTNFAVTGNPTPPILDAKISSTWNPVMSDTAQYLSINTPTDLKMESNMFPERISFWRTSIKAQEHSHSRDEL